VTGRKSSNLCVKRNLQLPNFKSILYYRFCCRMIYSMLPNVTWYSWQHLELRVTSDFSVILCDKKNKDTCIWNCSSGVAIWIPRIWNFHNETSLNVFSIRGEKNNENTYNSFSKIGKYNPPVHLWIIEDIGGWTTVFFQNVLVSILWPKSTQLAVILGHYRC